MKLKLVAAISALVAMPVLAHAQQGGPPPTAKPTKAEVQEVVQLISNDKAKTESYCELNKLNLQILEADQKNDSKAVETLGAQADARMNELGPEYSRVLAGWDKVDENSSEGKELRSILSELDNLCTK
jgi:hypothetical protein